MKELNPTSAGTLKGLFRTNFTAWFRSLIVELRGRSVVSFRES